MAAEGVNFELDGAKNNEFSSTNEPNRSAVDQNNRQYNDPRSIDIGGDGNILHIMFVNFHVRIFQTDETEF